jgi:hypothetical protein
MAAITIRKKIVVRAGSSDPKEYGANPRLFLRTLKRHSGFDINLLHHLDTRCVTNYAIKHTGLGGCACGRWQ